MKIDLKPIKKLGVGILLFIVAVILLIILIPIGLTYTIIKHIYKRRVWEGLGKIGDIFKTVAISVDMTGNVVLQDLSNDVLITPEGYKFGQFGETLSSALGKNKLLKAFKKTGENLCKILHLIDENHCENSINKN